MLKLRLVLLSGVLFLIHTNLFGQKSVNKKLKKTLDSIMAQDQRYREMLNAMSDSTKQDSVARIMNLPPASIADILWKKQAALDSANLIAIKRILDRLGYPGKSIVGAPSNEVAWNVIQHSNDIGLYLPVIRKAARNNEIPFRLYATMLDRFLVNNHREQIYGTQAAFRALKNGKTEWIIWPIKSPLSVNKRRRLAGFEKTVQDNAKLLDINYQVFRLIDLK